MKKILLLLAIAFSISFGASAMNLKEAFDALSDVPDVSKKADYNDSLFSFITNGQVAMAAGLNESKIFESGNAVYTILNRVPLSWMINGGNNNSVAAFVYANPESSKGLYETLIVLMSGRDGDITILYGDIDEATKTAIQNATLKMEGPTIKIHSTLPGGDTFNIQVE